MPNGIALELRENHKLGLVFTSKMADSTFESLINQRYKGQQHVRGGKD